MNSREILKSHYRRLSDTRELSWFSDHNYRTTVTDWITEAIEIREDDVVVDLGGGTGIYSAMIYERASLKNQVLCADMSKEMLKHAEHADGVRTLCIDALSFARRRDIKYDKIVLNGVAHHIGNRDALWKGIYGQLRYQGKVLIITRPPDITIPFFSAAMKTFKESQPHHSVFENEMGHAGFRIRTGIRSYHVTMDKERWFEIIRQRFMSNLAGFTDIQLKEGVEELKRIYRDMDVIDFTDNHIFITGVKG